MRLKGRRLTFAVVGDVHGQMHTMVRLVRGAASAVGREIDFVLQVGDFEPHRTEDDLATMSASHKHRKMGDFAGFLAGHAGFPWPVHFIGGNHEPYGFLDQLPDGGEVAYRCRYLGRVGAIELGGLRVVGLSGIYQEESYRAGRPPIEAIRSTSRKAYIGFTDEEVQRAAELGPADVLLLHEWPEGLPRPTLFDVDEVSYRPIGNAPVRALIELIQPRLVVCGHMHTRQRGEVATRGASVPVHCLASVHEGADSVAIYERHEDGALVELTR